MNKNETTRAHAENKHTFVKQNIIIVQNKLKINKTVLKIGKKINIFSIQYDSLQEEMKFFRTFSQYSMEFNILISEHVFSE